ncbi:MAG: DUF192 domain-containing protein [Deltaproteobacteria bacterium]|nr:DUF192 domain-containing protein [Deltaproteobacteria bacterium]
MSGQLRGLLLPALLALASGCLPNGGATASPEAWVEIRGHRIAVEIADTPEKQALGLGQRDDLAWDHGMFFTYARPDFYAFWMKGMRFSIDIVWILDNRIIAIDRSVPFEPGGNGPTLRPDSLVDAVLEVPAGNATARGWRIGDRVVTELASSSD